MIIVNDLTQDFIIIEDLLKESKINRDDSVMIHSVINKYKNLYYTHQNKNSSLVSFFFENRPNQQRVCWKYIVERFKSFGSDKFKLIADVLSEAHNELESDLIDIHQGDSSTIINDEEQSTQPIQIAQYPQNKFTSNSCNHFEFSENINENLANFNDIIEKNHKNKPIISYQYKRAPFQFAASQLVSIHMSKEILEILKYNVDEFCIDSQKYGLKEVLGPRFYESNSINVMRALSILLKATKNQDKDTLEQMSKPHIMTDELVTSKGQKMTVDFKVYRYEQDQRYGIILELINIQNQAFQEAIQCEPEQNLSINEFSYLNHYKHEYKIKDLQQNAKTCGYRTLNS